MKLKRTMAGLLAVILIGAMLVTPVAAAPPAQDETGPQIPNEAQESVRTEATKNETVYAKMSGDGSVEEVYVVNQLLGEYTDFGEYIEIKNLSSTSMPVIDGDMITFSDKKVEGGLYYQGSIEAPLPMIFKVKYYLDGKLTPVSNLGGASGHIKIEIAYTINDKCEEAKRDGLMAQIAVTLDMGNASNIEAGEATALVAGNTTTLNFTALPGESGVAILEADVADFEMDPITVTLMKGSIGDSIEESIEKFENGFDEMLDGADELVDGTTELKDGMESLLDGVGDLSRGISRLSSSTGEIEAGMQSYSDGLQMYLDGVGALGPGAEQIQSGLDGLALNGASLAAGLSQIDTGLCDLSASGAELKVLAESMLSSPDPSVQALAQGMLQTLGGVDALAAGLGESSVGLTQYIAGVSQMAVEFGQYSDGVQAVSDGAPALLSGYSDVFGGVQSFNDGVGKSARGAKRLYSSIKDLPQDVQLLIDGQIDFKDGIADAKDGIADETSILTGNDSPAVSFVSPQKNNPKSVQYILMIAGIEKPAPIVKEVAEEPEGTFFTRLADLFV